VRELSIVHIVISGPWRLICIMSNHPVNLSEHRINVLILTTPLNNKHYEKSCPWRPHCLALLASPFNNNIAESPNLWTHWSNTQMWSELLTNNPSSTAHNLMPQRFLNANQSNNWAGHGMSIMPCNSLGLGSVIQLIMDHNLHNMLLRWLINLFLNIKWKF